MQLARLALCARVLYEMEIIEQQKEIESLKLKLFWKEYGVNELRIAMMRVRHRRDLTYTFDDYEWMGSLIESCGLTRDAHLVWNDDYFITSYGPKLCDAKSVNERELKKLVALFEKLR